MCVFVLGHVFLLHFQACSLCQLLPSARKKGGSLPGAHQSLGADLEGDVWNSKNGSHSFIHRMDVLPRARWVPGTGVTASEANRGVMLLQSPSLEGVGCVVASSCYDNVQQHGPTESSSTRETSHICAVWHGSDEPHVATAD